MICALHSRTATIACAGVAAVITIAGLTFIAAGFLPVDNRALLARQQQLETRFQTLRIARELASGEMRQAAAEGPTQTR
jgi:hypothetical protein